MAKRNGIKPICFFMATIMCIILLILGLTSCGPTRKLEEREDYLEENGWKALIISENSKEAELIGNRESTVVNGEAVLPSSVKGYQIQYILCTLNGTSFSLTYYELIPDKLFIPGVNYCFSAGASITLANEKMIFLSVDVNSYKNGFYSDFSPRRHCPYQDGYIQGYYVAKTYLDEFQTKYNSYTCGDIKAANVSYYYNYEDAPNGGYCWIDDLDEGEKIKTIPQEPEREEYMFGGWFLEEQCLTKFDFDTYTMDESGELELFAKWIKK